MRRGERRRYEDRRDATRQSREATRQPRSRSAGREVVSSDRVVAGPRGGVARGSVAVDKDGQRAEFRSKGAPSKERDRAEMPPPRTSPRESRQKSPKSNAAAPVSGKAEAATSRAAGRPQVPSPKEKRSVKQEADTSSDDGSRIPSPAVDGEVRNATKLVERVQQELGDGAGPPWDG